MFVKNHKKINKQKRSFKIKIWAVKWTEGKRTQIIRWKKDNLQVFTSKKNVLRQLSITCQTITISFRVKGK